MVRFTGKGASRFLGSAGSLRFRSWDKLQRKTSQQRPQYVSANAHLLFFQESPKKNL
jgi:hypothetical protein